MKTILSILMFIFVFSAGSICAQHTIKASVGNISNNQGKVSFGLYDKQGFLKKPLQAKSAVIKNGESHVVFTDVKPGEYAVVCYHDKNENQIMDFEPNGMPLENYGASNNVMNFGPPQYRDAKFVVSDKNVSLNIRF